MRAQKYHFQSSEQTLLLFFSVSRHIASAFGLRMPSLFDKTTGKSPPTTGCIQKSASANTDLHLFCQYASATKVVDFRSKAVDFRQKAVHFSPKVVEKRLSHGFFRATLLLGA